MRKIALLTNATAVGFASTAPVAAKAARIEPVISAIGATDLPTPTRRGGIESKYPFDALEVGQSFGIKNKDKRGITSSISAQNRKYRKELKNPETGAVETVQTKHFVAVEIDAALAKSLKNTHLEGCKVAVKRDI